MRDIETPLLTSNERRQGDREKREDREKEGGEILTRGENREVLKCTLIYVQGGVFTQGGFVMEFGRITMP